MNTELRTLAWVGSPWCAWRCGSLGGVDRRLDNGSLADRFLGDGAARSRRPLAGPIVAHVRRTVASSPIVFAHRRLADDRHRLDSPPRNTHRARLHYISPSRFPSLPDARVRGRIAHILLRVEKNPP